MVERREGGEEETRRGAEDRRPGRRIWEDEKERIRGREDEERRKTARMFCRCVYLRIGNARPRCGPSINLSKC